MTTEIVSSTVNDISFDVMIGEDTFLVSTKDVAQVFAVSESAIRKHKSRGEFREGRHYMEGVTNCHSSTNQTRTMWTKRGIILLGFRLQETLYTVNFRDWAEDFIVSGGAIAKPLTRIEQAELNLKLIIELEAKEEKLALQAPQVKFANLVVEDAESIPIGEYAKVISDTHGLPIKVNELFDYLRVVSNHLMVGRDIKEKNRPYAKAIDDGLFEWKHVKTVPIRGKIYQPLVTGKGQVVLTDAIVSYFSGA